MADDSLTNPAETLLRVFDGLRNEWPRNPGMSGLDALRQTFGAFREPDAPESEQAFLRYVADVFALPDTVLAAMEAIHAHELEWAAGDLLAIRNGLSMSMLQGNFTHSEGWLNEARGRAIMASATRMNRSIEWSEREIPQEAIQELLAAVRALRGEVVSSDSISEHLRSWISEVLGSVETALIQYRLLGVHNLRDILYSVAGRLSYEPVPLRESVPDSIWSRVKTVMKTVERLVLFGAGVVYLGTTTPDALPWSHSAPIQAVVVLMPPTGEIGAGSATAQLPPAQDSQDDQPPPGSDTED